MKIGIKKFALAGALTGVLTGVGCTVRKPSNFYFYTPPRIYVEGQEYLAPYFPNYDHMPLATDARIRYEGLI